MQNEVTFKTTGASCPLAGMKNESVNGSHGGEKTDPKVPSVSTGSERLAQDAKRPYPVDSPRRNELEDHGHNSTNCERISDVHSTGDSETTSDLKGKNGNVNGCMAKQELNVLLPAEIHDSNCTDTNMVSVSNDSNSVTVNRLSNNNVDMINSLSVIADCDPKSSVSQVDDNLKSSFSCSAAQQPVSSNVDGQADVSQLITGLNLSANTSQACVTSSNISAAQNALAVNTVMLTVEDKIMDDSNEHLCHANDSTASHQPLKMRDDDRLSTASLDYNPLNLHRYDRHSVSSISSDTRIDSGLVQRSDMPLMAGTSDVTISHSIDKIWSRPSWRGGFDGGMGVVRSSWSQENYFDDSDMTCVDIDLEDENLASSVDVLHYRDTCTSAICDTSGHSWTEDDINQEHDLCSGKLRSWAPLNGDVFAELLSLDTESVVGHCDLTAQQTQQHVLEVKKKPSASFPVGVGIAVTLDSEDVAQGFPLTSDTKVTDGLNAYSERKSFGNDSPATDVADENNDEDSDNTADEPVCVEDVLGILATRPSSRDVDRPSAARLAKRLYYLHGFRKCDVSRHLTKKNSFSQLVGEEFLKFFDFSHEEFGPALRKFVRHLTPTSEAQDREQLLSHFAHHYHHCNPTVFRSEDCCHVLACAVLLLNSELHAQNLGHKVSLSEFVSSLNETDDFPLELLEELYDSIQSTPLIFEIDDSFDFMTTTSASTVTGSPSQTVISATQIKYNTCFTNPLLQAPDVNNVAEFKKGFIMRKCCVDPDGRKTPLGRRGWKMFYATLRDMTLYMYNDEHSYKRATHCSNVIHLHHALATKAGDYVKKNHVFRLQTADMAQYLIQTSDSRECQEWIDTINFVAASYSAPYPFDSASTGNTQKRFQRPLLPASYTTLNLKDQINYQEKMAAEFERELLEHRKDPPEKGARSRIIQEYCKKESYLKFEIKRYRVYIRLLQYKLAAFSELEPSLAETVIGEVDEPSTSPRHESASKFIFDEEKDVLHVSRGTSCHSSEPNEDAGYSSGLDTLHEV